MNKQFVDTGAFIAITDKSDQYHSRAATYFRKLLKFRHPLLTNKDRLCERSEPRSYPVVGQARCCLCGLSIRKYLFLNKGRKCALKRRTILKASGGLSLSIG